MTELTPIRRDILVDAGVEIAFEVFTDQVGSWWPLAGFSVYGEGSSVSFRDGAIVETAPDQPDTVWGTVIRWEPPTSVAFTWHPGGDPGRASRISVDFVPTGQQTMVSLQHAGWETFADAAGARAQYERGWPMVLEPYADSIRALRG